MTFNDYIKQVTDASYIQEWFVGEPVTQESAIDCIIEAYPLPNSITREMVAEWVSDEVSAFNDDCDPVYPDQFLPNE